MANTRKEFLDNLEWFNNELVPQMNKKFGDRTWLAASGTDLLIDDSDFNFTSEVKQDASYLVESYNGEDDAYEIGTRDIDRFIKDQPLTPMQKSEVLEKFGA